MRGGENMTETTTESEVEINVLIKPTMILMAIIGAILLTQVNSLLGEFLSIGLIVTGLTAAFTRLSGNNPDHKELIKAYALPFDGEFYHSKKETITITDPDGDGGIPMSDHSGEPNLRVVSS